jgi:teichuronic acid biosynthesis glycosyltransferase TuaC
MKVLIVCSGNSGQVSPYVSEQVTSLKKLGIDFSFFLIKGKGLSGYLKNFKPLNKKIAEFKPSLIHAHYGLSGLLANLQRKIPVILTLHGSDINEFYLFPLSIIAAFMSRHTIVVSKKMLDKSKIKKNISLIPCGIPIEEYEYISKEEARKILHLDLNRKYILFSSSFDNKVKNSRLAFNAIKLLSCDVELLELAKRNRDEVRVLFYACDVALLTSFNEGSPQFIKEAMICGCPIVSTDVGDVAELFFNLDGCYLCDFNPQDVSKKIEKALVLGVKTLGRQRIADLGLDSNTIASKIFTLYKKSINKCAEFVE